MEAARRVRASEDTSHDGRRAARTGDVRRRCRCRRRSSVSRALPPPTPSDVGAGRPGGHGLRADRDLPQLIMEGDSRVAEKASVLDGLQKEVEALSKTNAPTDEHLSSLTRAADELAAPAATTKVRGAALEVTLDDAKRTADSLPDGFTADDIVVHQQDVQAVVNALWTSGAEAMMIQDQRVISTSAVRCVGNTLILQGRVYAPPYRITAIGDIDRMERGLDADPSVTIYKQYVDAVGLGYGLHTLGSTEFPAYSGSVDFQYATPIRPTTATP